MQPIVVVSVVCFNNDDEIIEFANQISNQKASQNVVLLVICNQCIDYKRLKEELERYPFQTYVVQPDSNLGYLQGCLFGIKQYTPAMDEQIVWIICSNTDIQLIGNSFFEQLFNNTYNDDVWCIAPDITLRSNGARQNPFALMRFSKQKMWFYKTIYNCFPLFSIYQDLGWLKRKVIKNKAPTISSQNIYAPHGSCFIMRKELVTRIIEEKSRIYMYGEEILVAEIALENKKHVFYDDTLKIVHNANVTTSRVNRSIKHKWFSESVTYLYNRFFKN